MEEDGDHDDLVRSLLKRHPGESRGPEVIPTKVANHLKDWIPVFTGNPGFRGFDVISAERRARNDRRDRIYVGIYEPVSIPGR
jgi:hypothetical protein